MRHLPGGRHPPRVPRLARAGRPVVAQLSAAGMSTRAIAPVVGVTQKTVVKDSQAVREVIPEVSPAPVEPAEATELEEAPAQPEPPAAPTTATGPAARLTVRRSSTPPLPARGSGIPRHWRPGLAPPATPFQRAGPPSSPRTRTR